MGIAGFRALVAELARTIRSTRSPRSSSGWASRSARVEDYLHQALLDIGGWAAYARYLVWNSELYGRSDDTLVELLAIRVVWGYALFAQRNDAAFADAWRRAMDEAALPPLDEQLGDDPELCIDLIAQEAYERAYQRRLLAQLAATPASRSARPERASALQAAFCIDVRSEVYRRALEAVRPDVETIGFAGFFGFPIEYVPIGQRHGRRAVPGAADARVHRLRDGRRRDRRRGRGDSRPAAAAPARRQSVEVVQALGRVVVHLRRDGRPAVRRQDRQRQPRRSRAPCNDPNTDGLDAAVIGRLGPRIEPRIVGGRQTGFDRRSRRRAWPKPCCAPCR